MRDVRLQRSRGLATATSRRPLVLALALLAFAAVPAGAAGPVGSAAGKIPVTASYDGVNPIYSIASEKPAKRYRVTIRFHDGGRKAVRHIRSGQRVVLNVDGNVDHLRNADTTVMRVGNRPYSLQLRCIRKRR